MVYDVRHHYSEKDFVNRCVNLPVTYPDLGVGDRLLVLPRGHKLC